MSCLKRGVCLLAAVFLVAGSAGKCLAEAVEVVKVDVLGSAMRGKAEIGRAAAAMVSAQAALVKAMSEAGLDRAKAIQTLEQTRTVALDNNLKAATNFYEKRKLYDAYHALQAVRERPTREDLIRYSKEASPERPGDSQLSRGTIHWPDALQREEFLVQRLQLDVLFAKRTEANSGQGSDVCREVQSLAKRMRDDLKDMVQRMSPAEYLAARKFINALAYEAQFPPDVQGVAVR